jgi:hypothetical protein
MSETAIAEPGSLPLRDWRIEEFAQGVAAGLSLREAWIAAGYSAASDNSARTARRPRIAVRIEHLRRAANDRIEGGLKAKLQWYQRKLIERAFPDPAKFAAIDADGNCSLLDPSKAAAVATKFEIAGGKVRLEFDQNAAFTSLGKTLGAFISKTELTGAGGGPLVEPPSTADRARALAAFIAETQAEMATIEGSVAVNAAGNAEMSDGARAQHLMRPVGTAPESPKALALRVLTAVAQQFEALVADSDAAAGAVRGLRRLADAFDHADAADRAGAVAAFIARAKYEIGGPAQRVLRDAADALEAVIDDDAAAAFIAKNIRQLADGIEARSHEIPELLAGGQAARASR